MIEAGADVTREYLKGGPGSAAPLLGISKSVLVWIIGIVAAVISAGVAQWSGLARSKRKKLNMVTKRVAAKDLKVGDTVRWNGADGVVESRIHEIEEKGNGVRTIRLEPVGSCARMLNAEDKVEVLRA